MGQHNNIKKIMRSLLILAGLFAIAFGAPNNPYTSHHGSSHPHGGYQSHGSYHQERPHKECETHYKTIYKTVVEHKKIKKCEDVPELICKHIKEKVCHQEEEHKTGYGQGTHGYNSQYHHKPEVCHYEDHEEWKKHHKDVCHYETVDVPHKEPHKVPKEICTYKKHHSYSGK